VAKIDVRNITLEYSDGREGRYLALDDVSLSIEEGEFICILGPSGCGKSSLLSVLEGLNKPTKGQVLIDGIPVTGPGKERSVVFQNYSLFPWLTARQNVAFGIKQVLGKAPKRQIDETATHFLVRVGLEDFLDKFPAQLSGGMQQRVAIARALAVNPQILLMDEPFGAIDTKNKVILQQLLVDLWGEERTKKTVVFVTHDIDESIILADRIVFMGPKQIRQELAVDLARPRDRSTIFSTEAYASIRSRLVNLFYDDIEQKIDAEVVL
jgi:NitT/TauT family transport system ATP-binding protein